MSPSKSMQRIYIYTFVAVIIGILMLFKQDIRQLFGEDLKTPNAVDLAWSPPKPQTYSHKVLLALHYYNPRQASNFLMPKLVELDELQYGIHTLLLSGSSKVPTNDYLRTLAKRDWGIEEIRLHGTHNINLFAFLTLIKSNPTLKRVLIWENTWTELDLEKIYKLLPRRENLILK